MNYALVENGIVVNVIWLLPSDAAAFAAAQGMAGSADGQGTKLQTVAPLNDIPAGIGDAWDGERFYRDGAPVRTPLEEARARADAAIAELDEALLDAAYNSILGGLDA